MQDQTGFCLAQYNDIECKDCPSWAACVIMISKPIWIGVDMASGGIHNKPEEKTYDPIEQPPHGWKNCQKCGKCHPADMECKYKTYYNDTDKAASDSGISVG